MQQAAKMKAQRKTLILAGVIAIAWCSTCAHGADIAVKAPAYQTPVAPTFDWTGFYFGGHFGYIWGRTEVDVSDATVTPGGATNGFVGGVIGGGNWQFGSYVLGVEGDYGWAAGHGNGTAPVTTSATALYDYDLQWTSHVRGRLGYDLNGTLLYVAGGLALAYVDVSRSVTYAGASVTSNFLASGDTYTGGSIGAGVERAITNQLTGRVEYLYDDFGSKTYTSPTGALYRVHLTGDTLRGALTWKFY